MVETNTNLSRGTAAAEDVPKASYLIYSLQVFMTGPDKYNGFPGKACPLQLRGVFQILSRKITGR